MREIEVKARLSDKASFLKQAAAAGIDFGEPVTQDDTTYETTLSHDDPTWNIFRIRKQDGKAILTMKYKASQSATDNHERESAVENPDEIADMLERVGYLRGVRICKTRRVAKFNGLELCIDEVEDLGTFVEVEKLTDDDADVDEVQATLWKLLENLGVKPEDRVRQGYDTLIREYMSSHSS